MEGFFCAENAPSLVTPCLRSCLRLVCVCEYVCVCPSLALQAYKRKEQGIQSLELKSQWWNSSINKKLEKLMLQHGEYTLFKKEAKCAQPRTLSLSLSLLVTHTHIHTHTHSHTLTLTLKLTHTLSLSLSLTHTHIHRADAGSEYSKDGRLGSKSTCFERCSAHYPRRCQRGYVSSYASYYYYCHFVHLRTRDRGWGEVEGRDSETGRERERIRVCHAF